MNKLYWAKVKENAIIPTKRDEDAGYDIYACFDEDYIIIQPHETKMIPTGIASAFSPEFVMILKERGSTGTKGMGLRCGVPDSGYRGEYFVAITNHNEKPLIITKETDTDSLTDDYIIYPYTKAICQGVLICLAGVQSEEISYDQLKEFKSERQETKLGASGK